MSDDSRSSRPRRRGLRRAGVLLASLLTGLLLAEAGTRGVLRLRGEAWDTATAVRDVETILEGMLGVAEGIRLEEDERGEAARGKAAYELHPYVGYLPAMGFDRIDQAAARFVGAEHEQRYDVFLFGGSVAAGFRGAGMDVVLEALATAPDVRGRPVDFQSFAVPGYKQPQQLLLLTYLISRGCRPDLVLNLDGLNEIRIPPGNAARGLEPTFPSVGNWAMVSAGRVNEDPAILDGLLAVRHVQARAEVFGRRALDGGWLRSAIVGRWALSRLRHERAAWADAVGALEASLARGLRDGRPLPRDERLDADAVLDEAIGCWFEASLAMHELCAARGARYVHLLQPTLHDEGSKLVTPKEFEVGIGEGGIDEAVVAGYPGLRAGIARLAGRGVEALDTSGAFAEVAQTVYVDSCHLNRQGNRLLGSHVAQRMGIGSAGSIGPGDEE